MATKKPSKLPIETVLGAKGRTTEQVKTAVDLMVQYRIQAVQKALKEGGFDEADANKLLKSALKKVTPVTPRKKATKKR